MTRYAMLPGHNFDVFGHVLKRMLHSDACVSAQIALLLCRSGQLVTVTIAIAHAADPQKTPGGTLTMILFEWSMRWCMGGLPQQGWEVHV